MKTISVKAKKEETSAKVELKPRFFGFVRTAFPGKTTVGRKNFVDSAAGYTHQTSQVMRPKPNLCTKSVQNMKPIRIVCVTYFEYQRTLKVSWHSNNDGLDH